MHNHYLKNTIGLLLFYVEHFYQFSEVIYENFEKKHSFHNKHIYIYGLLLWSFLLYIL